VRTKWATSDISPVSDPIWQIFPLAEIEFFIKHLRDQRVSARGRMDAHTEKEKKKKKRERNNARRQLSFRANGIQTSITGNTRKRDLMEKTKYRFRCFNGRRMQEEEGRKEER